MGVSTEKGTKNCTQMDNGIKKRVVFPSEVFSKTSKKKLHHCSPNSFCSIVKHFEPRAHYDLTATIEKHSFIKQSFETL